MRPGRPATSKKRNAYTGDLNKDYDMSCTYDAGGRPPPPPLSPPMVPLGGVVWLWVACPLPVVWCLGQEVSGIWCAWNQAGGGGGGEPRTGIRYTHDMCYQ